VFQHLAADADIEYVMIDRTIVQAQHCVGADARVLDPLPQAGETAVFPPRGVPFAVSCDRHLLRGDRAELSRRHPARRQHRLA
jgi:hypothetical protein